MKKSFLICILISSIFYSAVGQNLTVEEITNLLNRKNWASVNSTLISKGWEFNDSKKGDSENYNVITWTLGRTHNYKEDLASQWLKLFTYEDIPVEIQYQVSSKTIFANLQKSLSNSGYKLIKNEVENHEILFAYSNNKFIVTLVSNNMSEEGYTRSITYHLAISRAPEIEDPKNGEKKEYWPNGSLKTVYTLKDGYINGDYTEYYENGNIRLNFNSTTFLTKEFDESGHKILQYTKLGDWKFGKSIEYFYDDNDKVIMTVEGNYKDDKKEGLWSTFQHKGKEIIPIGYVNYKEGVPFGAFKDFVFPDSVVYGTYTKSGKLNGEYKIKKVKYKGEVNSILLPEPFWELKTEGHYIDNVKTGKWSYFDFFDEIETGNYLNDQKHALWLRVQPHEKDSIRSETYYNNGLKSGKNVERRIYYVEKNPKKENAFFLKSYKIRRETNYEFNKKNGNYILEDSIGNILEKGTYVWDKKNGFWQERKRADSTNKNYLISLFFEKGNYENDIRIGNWIKFNGDESKPIETYNYKYGELDGDYNVYNSSGTLEQKRVYSYGKLQKVIQFDGITSNPIFKHEIFDDSFHYIFCRTSQCTDNYCATVEYMLSKRNGNNKDFLNFVNVFDPGSDLEPLIGFKHGNYLYFNKDSSISLTIHYDKNKLQGLAYYYDYKSKVILESEYLDDKKKGEKFTTLKNKPFSGTYNFIDLESGLTKKIKISKGVRNGKTITLDENKNIIKIEVFKNGQLKQ